MGEGVLGGSGFIAYQGRVKLLKMELGGSGGWGRGVGWEWLHSLPR